VVVDRNGMLNEHVLLPGPSLPNYRPPRRVSSFAKPLFSQLVRRWTVLKST
jgi:hypothetical protein